jgi:hypothetical protein
MRNDCGVDRMTDDEAIALRVTVIAGHRCADDFLVTCAVEVLPAVSFARER